MEYAFFSVEYKLPHAKHSEYLLYLKILQSQIYFLKFKKKRKGGELK